MSETSRGLMISELVETHGYDSEQLNQLSDEDLASELDIAKETGFVMDNSDSFEDIEIEESIDDTVATNDQIVPPLPTDPAWNDYVMAQFVPEELQDGNPTVDGLRRVVELLVGEVSASVTTITQVPNPNNGWTATATHNINIRDTDGNGRCYSGSADAHPDNTEHPYSKYPTAIAETRAEARALRRVLRLRTIAAEEVASVINGTPTSTKIESINDQQLNVIDILANNTRGKNIDVVALAKSILPSYNSIRKLSHDDGITLLTDLNKYQRGEKGFESVPDTLLGYKEDWRNK